MSNNPTHESVSPSWTARWVLRRNRVLGSRKFQDWAARTPIFRGVARRKAAQQFDLIAGFVYTQIVFVFVATGMIAFLRDGLHSTAAVGDFLRLDAAATDRILRAGAALDLAESPQQGLWTLGQVGAALSANDGALAMIRHHGLLYRDLADPMALLADRRGAEDAGRALAAFWNYDGDHDAPDRSAYSQLMAATQPMVWQQIIGAYRFAGHRKMLDIGGGSGAFAAAVAAAAPKLDLAIFDLPAVAALARERFADRAPIAVHAGSFKQDALPPGYDLITLVRILHDHDDDVAQALLAKIHRALPADGRLLIVEPMAETKGARGMGDAYFGLYLWAMGTGRPRSHQEIARMAKSAGFSGVEAIKTPLPMIASALVAKK